METTLTTPVAETTHSPRSGDSDPYPARADAGRRKGTLAAVLLGFAVVATGTWAAVTWTRTSVALDNADEFVVTPRDFSVVLKEKGELKPARSTEIVCEVEGRSTIISLIPEGTEVAEGDLLVELASDAIEDRIRQEELKESNAITAYEAARTELEVQRDKNASDIRKAELAIELARLELEKYEKGEWAQQLKDADIAIDQARINLERRTEDFEAAKRLYERDFVTKTEYDEDEFAFKRAQWELDKALKAREVLERYTHVATLRQRQSDLEEAIKEAERVRKNAEAEELKKQRELEGKKTELEIIQDQLAKLRTQREKCVIRAPTTGIVVYYTGGGRRWMSDDSQIREGATVHERQVLMTLPDTSEMVVVVRVHEAKTNKLQLGQRASVRVEGIPGRMFTGTVSKIAVVADSLNRWLNPDLKEYETEITLDSTDANLKPGVTAYAEILVREVEDALAVPIQSIYAKDGQRYVFRSERDNVVPRPVRLGAVGTEWAQVVEGLNEGERILLAFNDQHKRLIPDRPQRANRRAQPGAISPPDAGSRPGARESARGDRRERPAPGADDTATGSGGKRAQTERAATSAGR